MKQSPAGTILLPHDHIKWHSSPLSNLRDGISRCFLKLLPSTLDSSRAVSSLSTNTFDALPASEASECLSVRCPPSSHCSWIDRSFVFSHVSLIRRHHACIDWSWGCQKATRRGQLWARHLIFSGRHFLSYEQTL